MRSEEIEELDEGVVDSFLSFKLDGEYFGVDVKKVIEILEVPGITKIPLAPDYMAGIINLRGKVLPLIDTKVKFGLNAIEYTVDTCIVVIEIEVEGETLQLGTLVDSVQEVLEIPESEVQPSPSIEAKYKLEFIRGMIRKEDNFIMLLNLDEVFSIQDVMYMQEANESVPEKN